MSAHEDRAAEMFDDLEDEDADYDLELKVVRDRLPLPAPPPATSWYRSAPSLISLVAVVLAAAALLYTMHASHARDLRDRRQELGAIIQQLAQLRLDYQRATAGVNDTRTLATVESAMRAQHQVLLDRAATLEAEIPDQVLAAEYVALGWESEDDAHPTQARRFFRRAVAVARSPIRKVHALRSLGLFYFEGYQLKKARGEFRHAEVLLERRNDVSSQLELRRLYWTWADEERRMGDEREALRLIELGNVVDAKLAEAHPSAAVAKVPGVRAKH
jgi:hypothetical protein